MSKTGLNKIIKIIILHITANVTIYSPFNYKITRKVINHNRIVAANALVEDRYMRGL